ncbi:hypothetical protein [Hyphobacterium sp.]|uniref:hypothetical protein n=1 Tax=Hyphobacterium sp. TaxID=2004662 RepID=UPI003BAC4B73
MSKDDRKRRVKTVTSVEAYRIMHAFLEFQWRLRGAPADSLGELVSSSAMNVPDVVADPAIWQDWEEIFDEMAKQPGQ